jgi:hypothetical protein
MQFLYKEKNKYTTFYGGIITILCAALIIYLFINISRDCLYKLNPKLRETILYDKKSTIHMKNFFYGINFRDKDFNIIENYERYLVIEGSIVNNTISIQKDKEIHIPLIKCEIQRFSYYDFNDVNIKEYICLDLPEKFTLMNRHDEFQKISLHLHIKECKNKTSNNDQLNVNENENKHEQGNKYDTGLGKLIFILILILIFIFIFRKKVCSKGRN